MVTLFSDGTVLERMIRRNDALEYHRSGRPGKDRGRPDQAARHPARPVARVLARRRRAVPGDRARTRSWPGSTRRAATWSRSSPTAPRCSGLGNIGPLAGKPVMEGKACLFKKFADIDVFDLEVDAKDSTALHRRRSPRWSRRSAASTSRTSRRPSASRSRPALRDAHADPGVPRRSARHRDHLGRGADERRRAVGQEARRHEGRRLGRGRVGDRLRELLRRAGRAAARTSRWSTRMGVIYAGPRPRA